MKTEHSLAKINIEEKPLPNVNYISLVEKNGYFELSVKINEEIAEIKISTKHYDYAKTLCASRWSCPYLNGMLITDCEKCGADKIKTPSPKPIKEWEKILMKIVKRKIKQKGK